MRIESDNWYTAPFQLNELFGENFSPFVPLKKKWRKSAIQQIHMIFCKFENVRQKKQFSWDKIKIRVQLNTFWVAKKNPRFGPLGNRQSSRIQYIIQTQKSYRDAASVRPRSPRNYPLLLISTFQSVSHLIHLRECAQYFQGGP